MGIEQYAPWVSLLAAVLSIGYVAVDYWRPAPASAGREPTDRRSLGGFLDAYEGFFVVVGSTLVLAVAAHLGLRGTAFFYRRSRPSASGLDPEGEGRTLR
jgi:hypothetical protein